MDDENRIETPTTGMTEEQQGRVMKAFSDFLLSRLDANSEQVLTAELKTGLYHVLTNELGAITSSVVVGSTPDLPGVELDERQTPLSDEEMNELITTPNSEGATEK